MITDVQDLHYEPNWAKTKTSTDDKDLDGDDDISFDDVDVGEDLTTKSHPPESEMTTFSSKRARSRISTKSASWVWAYFIGQRMVQYIAFAHCAMLR
jgi:hypothetical protein